MSLSLSLSLKLVLISLNQLTPRVCSQLLTSHYPHVAIETHAKREKTAKKSELINKKGEERDSAMYIEALIMIVLQNYSQIKTAVTHAPSWLCAQMRMKALVVRAIYPIEE